MALTRRRHVSARLHLVAGVWAERRKPKKTHAVVALWLDTTGVPCWKVTIDTLNAAGEIVRSRLLHK
jgi:hypothetical protein